MGTYEVGEVVRVTLVITVSGVATDPTDLNLYIKDPSGNISSVTKSSLSKDDTGTYYYDIPSDESGVWRCRWEGTGTAAGAAEHWWKIRGQQVVPPS